MAGPATHYSGTARFFHWLTFLTMLVLVPTGLLMVYRGKDLNIWDGLTNNLYSTHKLVGVVILAVVAARLVNRLVRGAPPPEPSLTALQRVVSSITHVSLYLLLIVLPVTGWVGVSMFGALDVFGLFKLPALTSRDTAMSEQVLWVHGTLAYIAIALIALHIGAALFHHFVQKDGVLRRMWPSRVD